ncbi:MAG: hypothetical protein PVI07_10415 [Anaerolineae bacterium]
MPLLTDLLARVAFLAAAPAVIGVFVTASLLIVSQDWRLNVLALAGQYFFLALLMTQVVRVEMAAVKGLIGWLVCLVVYLTEQQAQLLTHDPDGASNLSVQSWVAARLEGWRSHGISARAAFGFLAALLVALTAYAVAAAIPLPQLPPGLTGVCYLLIGLGVLLLGLSQDPVRVGLGLLTFLSGFDLFYVALEPSLVVTGLLGSISFVIALGMAYLRTAHVAGGGVGGAR